MKPTRCEFINVTNCRRCKHKFVLTQENSILHTYNVNKYCITHMRHINRLQFLERCATIIQKYYIGFRVRNKCNNIFKKLPYDIRCLIIDKYVREDYYNNKYNKSLQKIVNNRLDIENNNYLNLLATSNKEFLLTILTNENNFMYISYLYNKYNLLIYNKQSGDLKTIIRTFGYALRNFHSEISFTQEEFNEIYQLILNKRTIYQLNDNEILDTYFIYHELKSLYQIIDYYIFSEPKITYDEGYGIIYYD